MKIRDLVLRCLKSSVQCRDDDAYLYYSVCCLLGYENSDLNDVLHKVNFNSVRSSRQHLQMLYPELQGFKFPVRSKKYDSFKKYRYIPEKTLDVL